MRTHLLLALVVALVLGVAAACGGGSDGGGGTPPPDSAPAADGSGPSAGAPIPGGGLTIEEALASTLEGPLMVKGYLVAPEGWSVRLCSALLESSPPQCGEPSLVVEGLDLTTVEGLVSTDDPSLARVTWSEAEISVLGTIEDGTITVGHWSTYPDAARSGRGGYSGPRRLSAWRAGHTCRMSTDYPPGWAEVDGALEREFDFPTFPDAIAFVNRVADAAEAANHHPDISISYRRVVLRLWTHTESAITEKDIALAEQISALAAS